MNNEWISKLKVGDPVIYSHGIRDRSVGYVERFTKTQLVIKGHYTKYRLSDGESVGVTDMWNYSSISEATKEAVEAIRKKKKRLELIHKLSKINWNNINTDGLAKILSMSEEYRK